MPRITKNPQERREEILDTAQALFGQKGYQQTAVSDIVKQIGVAQGTFYYYFKSKEEVADAIIARHLAHMLEPFSKVAGNGQWTAYEKMKVLLRMELSEDKGEGHEDAFQYLHHENNALLHQNLIVKMVRSFAPLLAAVFEQGVREGDFNIKEPLAVAEFFLTGFQFWLDSAIFHWTDAERRERVQSIGSIVEALLGMEPGMFSANRLLPGEH
ncbi:TetR/AcrR family transcriptional regulator [Paenibacillus oenotherae]|uniref:TetR/AcrR family transcriptional regulator n=1 Tax=Paenibacillus oenotherae TaxID=1435645 RepID=A0ABS7D9L8_9BACL|nr:TetR/AcrR family transcriptional regulator [Paenibacillus oenotherae]MBW7475868.1 TetR/AcrR family transcriptional regulator [Paenibacillus oenotherae]